MSLNYQELREEAVPIAKLIDAMEGEWDRHGVMVTKLRAADVVIGVDPTEDIGAILYGAKVFHELGRHEAKVMVFRVNATAPVDGTGGGTELDFLHAAIIAVKGLPTGGAVGPVN